MAPLSSAARQMMMQGKKKAKKGSHMMPEGKMMKNKEMKKIMKKGY